MVQDVLGFFLDLFDLSVRLANGHQEDVLDVHAIGHLILLDILLVLSLQLIVGDLQALANLVHVDDGVTDHALFRNLIRGLAFLVGGIDLGVA